MSKIGLNIEYIESHKNGEFTRAGYIVTMDEGSLEENHTLDELKQLHEWLGIYIDRREMIETARNDMENE